ncbi:MAG: hypothetical protein ACOYEN_05570 [Limnochordia bacterium]|jgi:hypothetical protein
MIRIGCINIDVSHPLAFSEYLRKGNRARYVAVYNDGFRGDDEVAAFIRNHGLEKRCATVDELAECVDIGFIQGCNWDKHLQYIKPFIDRGKPVFIDKPIVGKMKDLVTLDEWIKQGAVILGSSSVRYAEEIVGFAQTPETERGKILNVFGTSGTDEFNYGVHIVEGIGGLMGTGAVSTQYVGSGQLNDQVCETYYIRFKDGTTAIYNLWRGIWQPFAIVVMTTKTTYHFHVDTSKIYGALLDRICDFLETGKNTLAPWEAIKESIMIMLAGRISKEQGGKLVPLDSIPLDDPGYDGYAFAEKYAANAKKMYL